MTITVTISTAELPAAVQRGASTEIDDRVDVLPGYSGIDVYNRKSTRRPRILTVGYGIREKADRQAIYDLYITHGQLIGFLIRDPADYEIANLNIGTGDGANRSFYINKTYAAGGYTYSRRITRATESSLVITVGGTPSTEWTLSPLGQVLFNSGHAPASLAAVVITSGLFKIPVRCVGKLAFRMDTLLKMSVPTMSLKELFEV